MFNCPSCQSARAHIVRTDPPQAKCDDCSTIYDIAISSEPRPPVQRSRKKTQRPKRRRIDNRREEPPAIPPLTREQLGEASVNMIEIQAGGPRALIAAHREAERLGAKFGEEMEAKWFLKTKWLQQLEVTHRARARYALYWRPRFLAVVALTRSIMQGCRAAKVKFDTYQYHRKRDLDFDAQCLQAEEHAVAVLHDSCWVSAVEGDLEPVYWQGIKVGHVRKFDSRLRIEMLRAHMPEKFKTPGQAAVNISAPGAQVLVIGPEEQAELAANRRRYLESLRNKDQCPPMVDTQLVELGGKEGQAGGLGLSQ